MNPSPPTSTGEQSGSHSLPPTAALSPSTFSPQHHRGPEAEREQDSVGALLLPQPLRKPHLPEPHQERHQLRGRRSLLRPVQPAGEMQTSGCFPTLAPGVARSGIPPRVDAPQIFLNCNRSRDVSCLCWSERCEVFQLGRTSGARSLPLLEAEQQSVFLFPSKPSRLLP